MITIIVLLLQMYTSTRPKGVGPPIATPRKTATATPTILRVGINNSYYTSFPCVAIRIFKS